MANTLKGKLLFCDDNMAIKIIQPNVLVSLMFNKLLIIPAIQRLLNKNKVDDIVIQIRENSNNWLLSQGRISIGQINDSDKYYILDGQHRLEALSKLLNEQRINNEPIYDHWVEIIIIKFNSIDDMNKYYKDINVNTYIEPIFDFIKDNIIETTLRNFNIWLREKYSGAFRRNKESCASNKNNYHIHEWIALFSINDIKELYNKHSRDYSDWGFLRERIISANNLAKTEFNCLLTINNLTNFMDIKNYKKCVDHDFYLAYSNIKFMDYLLEKSLRVTIENI